MVKKVITLLFISLLITCSGTQKIQQVYIRDNFYSFGMKNFDNPISIVLSNNDKIINDSVFSIDLITPLVDITENEDIKDIMSHIYVETIEQLGKFSVWEKDHEKIDGWTTQRQDIVDMKFYLCGRLELQQEVKSYLVLGIYTVFSRELWLLNVKEGKLCSFVELSSYPNAYVAKTNSSDTYLKKDIFTSFRTYRKDDFLKLVSLSDKKKAKKKIENIIPYAYSCYKVNNDGFIEFSNDSSLVYKKRGGE